jgi:hypothetical protein
MFRDKTNLLLSSFQTFWKYERTTFIYFSFLSGALFILLDLLIYSKFQGDTHCYLVIRGTIFISMVNSLFITSRLSKDSHLIYLVKHCWHSKINFKIVLNILFCVTFISGYAPMLTYTSIRLLLLCENVPWLLVFAVLLNYLSLAIILHYVAIIYYLLLHKTSNSGPLSALMLLPVAFPFVMLTSRLIEDIIILNVLISPILVLFTIILLLIISSGSVLANIIFKSD